VATAHRTPILFPFSLCNGVKEAERSTAALLHSTQARPQKVTPSLPPSHSVVVSRPLPGAGAPPSLVGFDQTPPPFPFLGERRHFCHCASIDQCLTSLSSACCCRDSRISPSATIGLSPPSNTVALVYFRCITVAPLPCTLPSDKLLPDAFPTLPWCSSHRCGI
jgi:hypothetical protein